MFNSSQEGLDVYKKELLKYKDRISRIKKLRDLKDTDPLPELSVNEKRFIEKDRAMLFSMSMALGLTPTENRQIYLEIDIEPFVIGLFEI